ncbi:uncharacterized protein LOC114127870 isoform X3 [Aphis gossypii]|uniref:uncharacterized protein LOC114127870 isoform X3 n=1 Tax=Aphis gossypii TaxID=80765 RepID=UPI002159A2C5|nr:uncharacterized protein LOC114127870 isoform X3 [Aphis gossypii]
MDQEPSNNKSKYIEFIFFLDCINNLEASLNFPINFNVYFEFHGNLLSVGDVIITLMDTDGKIDLEVSLSFPLDEIVEYKFASHPMLSDTSDEVETSVKVCGQYPLKAIGERNQNLLSDAAYLNAALSCPTRLNRIGLTTPNNVLNIAMHGLYNPSLSGRRRQSRGSDTTCSAILHVPSAIDSEIHSSIFERGTFTDVTRDVNDLRWFSLDNMPATVSTTGQRFEEYSGIVVNSAKIPKPKNVLFKGPRFEWNLWNRFLMNEISSYALQEFIFKQRYLLVTFLFNENNHIMINNTRKTPSRDSNMSVNNEVIFVAFLDLSMLLQPNCTSIRCLSTVHSIDVEIVKHNELSFKNFDLGKLIKTNIEEDLKKSRTTVLDASDNEGVSTQMSTEWTFPFVVVDISVNYSLYDQYLKYLTSRQIALMQMNIISESPQAVICNRPKLNKYQDILKTIIEMLINNLERINDQYSVDVERYVQELRISETYESMYSLLFGEIQLYIRENYESPMIGETIQSFVNRIFTDLVNKMKKAVESFEFPQSGSVDSIQFERVIVYAREADEMEQAERAKIFYFDLNSTAGARCNPNYWLLYASLCSRRLDFDTALEYVKEVLLVDSGNRIGLFLYAAIQLIIHEDNNNGEIVLKSLIMSHGDFSEVYALLSVHYSRLNMYESSYIMLQRAERCVKVDTFENNSLICENLLSWTPISHENDPLIKCTILLLELELVQLAKYCLKCVKNQSEQYHYYMAVCEYKKGNHLASLEHLKNHKLMEKYKKVTDALKFLNDIELNEQLDIFENDLLHIIYSEPPSKELHLIYLKGAIHCYKNEWYVKGAEICQIACTVLRTPMILTLLAKCLIQISEFETAESALNEANVMDIKNEEVWAYLTVVNIKMGNVSEAKVCYIRALECGLQTEMKNEINKLFGKELDILI